MGLIYKITNLVNGKIYIGRTETSINRRMICHKFESNHFRSFMAIHKAMRKYGIQNFSTEILESSNNCSEREKFYIQQYNSMDKKIGYNQTPGGEGNQIFGEKNPNSKLTWDLVNEIREFYKNTESFKQLKLKYPMVTKGNFYNILHNKTWNDSKYTIPMFRGNRILTDAQVIAIRKLLATGAYSRKCLEQHYGISKTVLAHIAQNRTYKNI